MSKNHNNHQQIKINLKRVSNNGQYYVASDKDPDFHNIEKSSAKEGHSKDKKHSLVINLKKGQLGWYSVADNHIDFRHLDKIKPIPLESKQLFRDLLSKISKTPKNPKYSEKLLKSQFLDANSTSQLEKPKGREVRAERRQIPERQKKEPVAQQQIIPKKICKRDMFPFSNYNLKQMEEIQKTKKIKLNETNQKTDSIGFKNIILPSSANWFSFQKIHEIEKQQNSEWFSQGSNVKTSETYQKLRNYIVMLYMENPKEYLTVTEARKNLTGDPCSFMRIHHFLEEWGIINYNISIINKEYMEREQHFQKDQQDLIDKDKQFFEQSGQCEMVFQVFKSMSEDLRPICHNCGCRSGLSWYQQKKFDLSGHFQIQQDILQQYEKLKQDQGQQSHLESEQNDNKNNQHTTQIEEENKSNYNEFSQNKGYQQNNEVNSNLQMIENNNEKKSIIKGDITPKSMSDLDVEEQDHRFIDILEAKNLDNLNKLILICNYCFSDNLIPNTLSQQDFIEIDLISFITEKEGQIKQGDKQIEKMSIVDQKQQFNLSQKLFFRQLMKIVEIGNFEMIQQNYPLVKKEEILVFLMSQSVKKISSSYYEEQNSFQNKNSANIEKKFTKQINSRKEQENCIPEIEIKNDISEEIYKPSNLVDNFINNVKINFFKQNYYQIHAFCDFVQGFTKKTQDVKPKSPNNKPIQIINSQSQFIQPSIQEIENIESEILSDSNLLDKNDKFFEEMILEVQSEKGRLKEMEKVYYSQQALIQSYYKQIFNKMTEILIMTMKKQQKKDKNSNKPNIQKSNSKEDNKMDVEDNIQKPQDLEFQEIQQNGVEDYNNIEKQKIINQNIESPIQTSTQQLPLNGN